VKKKDERRGEIYVTIGEEKEKREIKKDAKENGWGDERVQGRRRRIFNK
jgi:hypothetical protein